MRVPVLASVLVLCLPSLAWGQEGKRYAVVVGVNNYQYEKLKPLDYAVNDAVELGQLLEKAGYSVITLTDDTGQQNATLAPTKTNIERHLNGVLEKAQKGDLVLVAFAGHGLQFEGQKDAYFCPSDAKPFKDRTDTLLSLNKIYDEMGKSFAGMKVILVDACRDDPTVSRGSQGVTADGAPLPPKGVAALFSCSAGQRAFEHKNHRHGIFFHHVLKGLSGSAENGDKEVTFNSLSDYVAKKVQPDVNMLIGGGARQVPNQKADLVGGSPVLVTRASVARPEDDRIAADFLAYERAVEYSGASQTFMDQEAPEKIAFWRQMAESGNSNAQVLLARCLSSGSSVKQDEKEAAKWLKKAAEAGNGRAMVSLGLMYAKGRGLTPDSREAFKWIKKAAEAGHTEGMNQLGQIYFDERGEVTEAIRWFMKAAEAGNTQSMCNLGAIYARGDGGLKPNPKAAFQWIKKAAETGDAGAMFNLGAMYREGRGVNPNPVEAVKWFMKAAEAGDTDGMFNVGMVYLEGRVADSSPKEAVHWLRRAAEAGHSGAMCNLGLMYLDGRGVKKNQQEAVKWLRKAADKGDLYARDALKRAGKK